MGWTGRNNDQWIEYADQEWTVQPDPFYLLKQIWHDEDYVYAATSDGLNIIELESELSYAHVTYYDGFNSVWADDNNVYLATPASGVKYIDKTCISGSTGSPYELITSGFHTHFCSATPLSLIFNRMSGLSWCQLTRLVDR